MFVCSLARVAIPATMIDKTAAPIEPHLDLDAIDLEAGARLYLRAGCASEIGELKAVDLRRISNDNTTPSRRQDAARTPASDCENTLTSATTTGRMAVSNFCVAGFQFRRH